MSTLEKETSSKEHGTLPLATLFHSSSLPREASPDLTPNPILNEALFTPPRESTWAPPPEPHSLVPTESPLVVPTFAPSVVPAVVPVDLLDNASEPTTEKIIELGPRGRYAKVSIDPDLTPNIFNS